MYFPKISVIVAVFNGSATLLRCLNSIYSQSHNNYEIIVIDGGSKDGTIKILQDNSKRIDYWESVPDRGIYHAWNKALSHAKGEWICFLGSDDFFWDSEVFKNMLPRLQIAKNDGVRLVYGRVASVDKIGKVKNLLGIPWNRINSVLAHQMPPHPGLLHSSLLFKEHGTFDESFRIAGDYEFLLRELKTGDATFIPDIIVAGVQYGGVSCNKATFWKLIVEDVAARQRHRISLINTETFKYYARLLYHSFLN
jgi:glycosyltransferase involved in cell wall biosynthesis